MNNELQRLIDTTTDEMGLHKVGDELCAADYEILMSRIDHLMELNNGEGPDPIREPANLETLRRAAIIAERYEERVFPL
jgi:hypothetical protein